MGYLRFLQDNARWLAAAFILALSSSFGQTFFISIFAGDIRAEFGLSHGEWGGIYTIGTTISAVVMVWAGVMTDRFRVRTLGPVFLILLAISCASMAYIRSPLALLPVIFALRFTGQGMLSHIGTVATVRWFVASRGRALAVGSLGFAIGSALLPVLFVSLLPFFNWRILWLVSGGAVLVAIPILLPLLAQERSPQSLANGTQSTGMGGVHWKRSEILRHWLFWLMVPTLIGPAAWSTALFFQQVHLAEVKGWSHLNFVALFPIYTAGVILMTFATGWLVDRFSANRVMPFYLLPFIAGFLFISSAQTLFGAAIGMALVGIAGGFGNTVVGSFWAEHCGTRYIGSVKALAAAVMVFGSAIGPGVTGLLIDRGIDFPDQMVWIAIYFSIAAILAFIATKKARDLLPHTA